MNHTERMKEAGGSYEVRNTDLYLRPTSMYLCKKSDMSMKTPIPVAIELK